MLSRAVIFDLEGVIIDTQPLWEITTRELLAGRGIEFDRDRLTPKMAGCSLPQGSAILKHHTGLDEDVETIVAERLDLMTAALERGASFIPGFEEFFEWMSEGRDVAIGTSMAVPLLGSVRTRLGLDERFGGHVYDVSMVGDRGKPRPDLFLHAAEQLGARPDECTVIEDAPNGIAAARAAGMRSIGIATTFRAELLSDADLVVETFADIPRV